MIAAAHFDFVIQLKNLVNPSARPLWCPTKSSVFFQIALSKQTLNLYPKMQHKRQFPSNVKVFPFLRGYWVKRCNCNSAKWAKFFWSIFQRKLILVINLQNYDSFANVHPNIFVSSLLFCKSGGGVKYFTINQRKGLLPVMNNKLL